MYTVVKSDTFITHGSKVITETTFENREDAIEFIKAENEAMKKTQKIYGMELKNNVVVYDD